LAGSIILAVGFVTVACAAMSAEDAIEATESAEDAIEAT
jgi:hypothetical protein